MNLSYTIEAHSNPEQFGRLIQRLNSPNVRFFVHIDAKTDIEPFKEQAKGYDNLLFCEQRVDVIWGDYSVLQAFIECLKLIRIHAKGSYVINLSGQDYPLKTNEYIYNYILANPETVYIKHFSLPAKEWEGENGGMDRIFYWTYHFYNRVSITIIPFHLSKRNRRNFRMAIKQDPRLFPKLLIALFTKRNPPIPYKTHYGGEFWMSMPEKISSMILGQLEQNPKIEKFYLTCSCPDELLFQTLILNQQESKKIHVENNCLKYIDWSGKRGLSPLTFNMEEKEDLTKAMEDPKILFARKFDENYDSQILDYIDTKLSI